MRVERPKTRPKASEIGRLIFDRLAAGVGLIVLAPLLIAVVATLAASNGLPIFFQQTRVGRFGRHFTLLKFRTMRLEPGLEITSLGDSRITPLGRVLRRYKLDELPQLWNVWKGEMSLIGPRPEVPAYVDIAEPRRRSVLEVPPGITDLAGLLYRDEERILARSKNPEDYYRQHVLPEKLRLSLLYIERRSFSSDIKLLALTVWYALVPSRFDAARVSAFVEILARRQSASGHEDPLFSAVPQKRRHTVQQ